MASPPKTPHNREPEDEADFELHGTHVNGANHTVQAATTP